MTKITPTLLALALSLPVTIGLGLGAGPAEARAIERACLQSNRNAATPSRCGCIQRVADQMLTSADQRKAARFFRDPQRAQEVRKSDSPRDDAFWKRWQNYGRTAADVCN